MEQQKSNIDKIIEALLQLNKEAQLKILNVLIDNQFQAKAQSPGNTLPRSEIV